MGNTVVRKKGMTKGGKIVLEIYKHYSSSSKKGIPISKFIDFPTDIIPTDSKKKNIDLRISKHLYSRKIKKEYMQSIHE